MKASSQLRSIRRWVTCALAAMSIAACGAPEPPPSTGGTTVPPGPCGRGLVVVASDYQSSNVSLVGWDGAVLSASFVSSGTEAPGLSSFLSGDVVAPTTSQSGDHVVLVDRYPNGVLTRLTVATAAIEGQLDVKTGFRSNPQDYVEAGGVAVVSRYDANPAPGAEPFDEGSDLLVVDAFTKEIEGRIDFDGVELEGLLPRPGRMVVTADGRLFVLHSTYSLDFKQSGAGRLAEVDLSSRELVSITVLDGLTGCVALALSPGGARVAVGCSGTFGGDSLPSLEDAGAAIVDVSGAPFIEATVPGSVIGDPPGLSVAFASEGMLLLTTLGREASGDLAKRDDRVVLIDVAAQTATDLAASAPFALGEVRCAPACGACFYGDAGEPGGTLWRAPVEDGSIGAWEAIHPAPDIGLPPRYLGGF